MYWVKNNVGKIDMDEISIDEKLLSFRKEQENFIEPSFNTIAGYKDHGAIIHYSATKETVYKLEAEGLLLVDSGGQYYDGTTDITRMYVLGEIPEIIIHYSATKETVYKLEAEGLLLVDSGGQYYDGTTDITRMYVLGEIPEIQKTHFTAVTRGMIKLSMAKFMYGCRGYNLDILARGPLWEMGLDYRCGTGHGIGFVLNVHEAPNGFRWKIVPERNDSCILARGPLWEMGLDYRCGTGHGIGFVLNVHEAPNGFRWKIVPERNDSCILEEGMVTTNEPGVYIDGSHGIRIENELITIKGEATEYGQFMEFEAVTLAEGMVTTNEPGVYIDGSHGIRIENELITIKGEATEYGQFMEFEAVTLAPIDLDGINPELMERKSHGIRIENELITIKGEATEYGQFMEFEAVTLAPIDLDGINPELMERKEIEYLNNYHKKVYEEISPFLNEDEKEWLKEYTRSI